MLRFLPGACAGLILSLGPAWAGYNQVKGNTGTISPVPAVTLTTSQAQAVGGSYSLPFASLAGLTSWPPQLAQGTNIPLGDQVSSLTSATAEQVMTGNGVLSASGQKIVTVTSSTGCVVGEQLADITTPGAIGAGNLVAVVGTGTVTLTSNILVNTGTADTYHCDPVVTLIVPTTTAVASGTHVGFLTTYPGNSVAGAGNVNTSAPLYVGGDAAIAGNLNLGGNFYDIQSPDTTTIGTLFVSQYNPMIVTTHGNANGAGVFANYNDLPTNTTAFPAGIVAYANMDPTKTGNQIFGVYSRSVMAQAAGVASNEFDCFNTGGAPDTALPPNQAIGTSTRVCDGLQLSAGGSQNSSIGLYINTEPTSTAKFNTGEYIQTYGQYGLYIDSQTSATDAIVAKGNVLVAGGALTISGNISAPAWTTNGIGLGVGAASYTDTTSSGTVAEMRVNTFNAPTLLASSATTYTTASTLNVALPIVSTNVTVPNLFALHVGGNIYSGGVNISQPAWTTNGIAYRQDSAAYTDTTSSGTVAETRVSNFGGPTLLASSATTYTKASTLHIGPAPIASTNVTITNGYSLDVGGPTLVEGALTAASNVTMTGLPTTGTISTTLCLLSTGALRTDTANCFSSLRRLKRDIADLSARHALDTVMRLKPVAYNRREGDTRRQAGFIAEDVQKIEPRCAAYDGAGELEAYHPECLTAILAAAVQAQQAEIVELKKQIANIRGELTWQK